MSELCRPLLAKFGLEFSSRTESLGMVLQRRFLWLSAIATCRRGVLMSAHASASLCCSCVAAVLQLSTWLSVIAPCRSGVLMSAHASASLCCSSVAALLQLCCSRSGSQSTAPASRSASASVYSLPTLSTCA